MKTHSILAGFVILVALGLSQGCSHSTKVSDETRPLFAIDLQDGFQHDVVTVSLDNRTIYNDSAFTNSVLSLAVHLSPSVSAGSHRIQASIPELSAAADTVIDIRDTMTVGINYNRSANHLSFTVYHNIVLYM
ncbi:MAG TPA: hypothetical protein VLX91_02310 [Candidatus Acidoferrales bacterium]|nr:hypothetical protein [Candidatus Acidoferrales bacterium]